MFTSSRPQPRWAGIQRSTASFAAEGDHFSGPAVPLSTMHPYKGLDLFKVLLNGLMDIGGQPAPLAVRKLLTRCLNLYVGSPLNRSSFTMSALLHGCCGAMPPCSDHRDGATARMVVSNPCKYFFKELSCTCIPAGTAPHQAPCRCSRDQQPTCVPAPCLPCSIACPVVMEDNRDLFFSFFHLKLAVKIHMNI